MLLPSGKSVRVGWSETEVIWLQAAVTLRGGERKQAYYDLASLTGRSFLAVQSKATYLLKLDRDAARALLAACLGKPQDLPQKVLIRTNTMSRPHKWHGAV